MKNEQTAVKFLMHHISEDQLVKAKSAMEWVQIFEQAKEIENKQYTRDEVHMLMCLAFEQGFKKSDVVDAGLEGKETDVECAWILTRYDSSPERKEYYEHNTSIWRR